MDDKKTVWIKQEESTSAGPMVQVYPFSMKLKEELQEKTNEQILEDPLPLEKPCVDIKEDVEWKMAVNTSDENTYLDDHLEMSPPTDYIKVDLEDNLDDHLEREKLESIYLEDHLEMSPPTDYIKVDLEDNSETEELESIIDGHREFSIPECEFLRIKNKEEIASKRHTPERTRPPKTTSGAVGTSFEETCLQEIPGEETEIAAEKSAYFIRSDTRDQVTLSQEDNALCNRNNHNSMKTDFQYFFCSSCKERFLSKYTLINHVFCHIDGVQSPAHICKWCGEVFVTCGSLKKHLTKSNHQKALALMKEGCDFVPEKLICDEMCKNELISNGYPSVSDTENFRRDSLGLETCNTSNGKTRVIGNFSCTEYCRDKSSLVSGKLPQSVTHINGPVESHANACHIPHNSDSNTSRGHLSIQQGICREQCATISNQSSELLHSGEASNKCDISGISFCNSINLNTAHGINPEEKPCKCDICGKSFPHFYSLKTHSCVHTGQRTHKCNVCEKNFTRAVNLKKHSSIHTGKLPHKCNVCGKCFTQLYSLKMHMRIHTGEKPHKCDVCGKTFTQIGNLKSHLNVHTGERLHKCHVCGKSFTLFSSLKVHKRIHTGEKPYKCYICEKSFRHLGGLRNHKLFHSGEKPHKCDICGKCFATLGNFKEHRLTHTSERPYKCTVCAKSFILLCYLKNHERIHTGERPHKCEICGKSYTLLRFLKRHVLSHSSERSEKCNV